MTRARRPVRLFYWGLAAYLMMMIPLVQWATTPSRFFGQPETPLSHIDEPLAEQWLFTYDVRDAVLPDSTYTIRARTPLEEMNIFMFSQGLMVPRKEGLATTYFGVPFQTGANARFVVAFHNYTANERGLKYVVHYPGGVVYERPGKR